MLHMKPAAVDLYLALLERLDNVTPDCQDDSRYIAERGELTKADRAELAAICDACPLFAACSAYAQAAHPQAGWWPGHNLKTRTKEAAA